MTLATLSDDDDVFYEVHLKESERAQRFVDNLRKRIASIEAVELTDVSFRQRQFLQECIEIILYQNSQGQAHLSRLGSDVLVNIDTLTELEQTKLECNRLRRNNALLIKVVEKIKINIR